MLLLPGARPQGVALGAVLTVLGSSLLWAFGSVLASRADLPADGLLTTVLEMLAGGAGLVVAGLLRGEVLDRSAVELSSVARRSATWSCSARWSPSPRTRGCSATRPISWVATYAYVNPVVAVVLGALFVDERVTATTLAGGALTLLAVAVVVAEEGRRRRAATGAPVDAPAT